MRELLDAMTRAATEMMPASVKTWGARAWFLLCFTAVMAFYPPILALWLSMWWALKAVN